MPRVAVTAIRMVIAQAPARRAPAVEVLGRQWWQALPYGQQGAPAGGLSGGYEAGVLGAYRG